MAGWPCGSGPVMPVVDEPRGPAMADAVPGRGMKTYLLCRMVPVQQAVPRQQARRGRGPGDAVFKNRHRMLACCVWEVELWIGNVCNTLGAFTRSADFVL